MSDLVQIAGTTLSPTLGNFAGLVWQQGHMTELPSPPGSSALFGIHLNLLGQVVGVAYDANSNIRGEIAGYGNDAANIVNTVVWRHGTTE